MEQKTPAAPDADHGWRVQLLGSLDLRVGGRPPQPLQWRLRKSRDLLAMLALAPGQACRREQVIDRLWPDLPPAAAARNLHQTLYVGRRTLRAAGVPPMFVLDLRQDQVLLDSRGLVPTDVQEFDRLAAAALATGDEPSLRAANALYAGDLLPDLVDAAWATTRRRELQDVSRDVRVRLAAAVRDHAPEEALLLLAPVLVGAPVHEGAVRGTMLALTSMGRRSEALARYEQLVADLLQEFGTDPDPETSALFRELLTGAAAQVRPGRRTPESAIPVPPTTLIGRERELADLTRILADARLLTLTGTGGCGKTRLALETARQARPAHRDGVWFVDLSGVAEARLVPDIVASVIGLDTAPGPDRVRALVDQLRNLVGLVVLDNCEHVLAICAQLAAEILAGCPGVAILATSRAPLHIGGEHTFRVPSLTLPAPAVSESPDPDTLRRTAAVRLFEERAGQARSGFTLTNDNATAVCELCRRLDGIPLALELAAARTTALEPAEIVARLGGVLDLLRGSAHGGTRHETLRATLEWSHTLLTPQQQILLRRLSVFAGGVILEAVEEVCSDDLVPAPAVPGLLADLVDQSLVVVERTPAGTRYRLLETVRQLGREHLVATGEEAYLARAHCAYFLRWAVSRNPERMARVVIESPRTLDSQHDNLRAALLWSCVNEPDTALRLAASLWRYWFVRGYAVEGAQWVERALAAAPAASRPRAAALIGLAGLDSRQGRSDRHRALGAEAVAVVREVGTARELLMARLVEASLVWSTFGVEQAERLIAGVRAEARELGWTGLVAAGQWLLAQCALTREDGTAATDLLNDCLAELAGCEDEVEAVFPVVSPSLQLIPLRARVVPSFEETLLLGRRVGPAQARGYVLSALGHAAKLAGDVRGAVIDSSEALAEFVRLGDDLARGQVLHQLGCVLRDAGQYAAAREPLAEAKAVRTSVGDRRGEHLTALQLALLSALVGEVDAGRADAQRCLAAFEASGDPVGMGAALTMLAGIELVAGDREAARELHGWAAARLRPWRRHAGWAHLMAAELSVELGDERRAQREAGRAAAALGDICRVAVARMAALPGGARPR